MAEIKKILVMTGLILIVILLTTTLASANLVDYLRAKLTGRATTSNVQINISIGNSAPNITYVKTISNQIITEDGQKPVTFDFIVEDIDGWQNIDASSGRANFTYSNASTLITRNNDSCVSLGSVSTTQLNISCTINMWYFDASGTWNITAYATDVSGAQGQNRAASLVLSPTKALLSGPGNLTFSTLNPGDTNTTADNNPLTLNNTGNVHIPEGNISVNATDLVGETNAAYALYARNFTIGITQGGTPAKECGGVNSTFLLKSVYQNISNATLPYGNHSAGGGTGQEGLYLCLTLAGSELLTQAYSTAGEGAWTIQI
ncbi:hypothetical protein COU61_03675 [Candidatus Pacearchaeota archaeon CG10_big_fil_rev_8_21_14_0_10_35_13]|nr:MAG: hypothetical protein COU61_03675 [Candidatus Pacearchaeota archaeon CG10_big_fil_rev_8_21_14_0_10_35_13]